jgi:hypothetical protein
VVWRAGGQSRYRGETSERFGRRVEGNPLLHPGARIEVDLEVLRLPDGCRSAPLVQDELKTPRGTGERRMRQSADDFPLHLREQTFLNDRHDVDVTPAWYIVPKRKRSDEISGEAWHLTASAASAQPCSRMRRRPGLVTHRLAHEPPPAPSPKRLVTVIVHATRFSLHATSSMVKSRARRLSLFRNSVSTRLRIFFVGANVAPQRDEVDGARVRS